MKFVYLSLSLLLLPMLSACASNDNDFIPEEQTVEETDEGLLAVSESEDFSVVLSSQAYWNGEIFPPTGSCRMRAGLGMTPTFIIKNAPAGTNVILLEFNNLSVAELATDGGLGTVGYVYKSTGSDVVLFPVQGGKVKLPAPAFLEKTHRVGNALPAAYFPPCLRREIDQDISVTVKAVKRTGDMYSQKTEVLDSVVIPLGVLKD